MLFAREHFDWGSGELKILCRYFAAGESLERLSLRFLRSPISIRQKLISLGLYSEEFFQDEFSNLIRAEQQYFSDDIEIPNEDYDDIDYQDVEENGTPEQDFDEWVSTLRLYLSGWNEDDTISSKWEHTEDDLDSRDWEDYLGGPSDDYFER